MATQLSGPVMPIKTVSSNFQLIYIICNKNVIDYSEINANKCIYV